MQPNEFHISPDPPGGNNVRNLLRKLLADKLFFAIGSTCIVLVMAGVITIVALHRPQTDSRKDKTSTTQSSVAEKTDTSTKKKKSETEDKTKKKKSETDSSSTDNNSQSQSKSGSSGSGGSETKRSLNCAPDKSDTMTNNVSHLCGYPDVTNTGPVAGTKFVRVPEDATSGDGWTWDPRGWISISSNNVTVSGIKTTQTIDITGNNVTLKNCKITQSSDGFGVSMRHTSNVTVKNCQISGTNSGSGRLEVAIKSIYGDDVNPKSINNNIYYVSTGIQYCQGLLQGNYIHDMGIISGDHINGTTSNAGCDELTIKGNTSFNQLGQTDAISLFQDFGVQKNALITNNLVAGGGYCIYGGDGSYGPSTNIRITNNHYSRIFFPNCGGYGPMAAFTPSGPGNEWSGNVWDDTGKPVTF